MKNIYYCLLPTLLILIGACKKTSSDTAVQKVYLPSNVRTYMNGSLTDSVAYKYDSSNRIIEIFSQASGMTAKNTFDVGGNLSETTNSVNGVLAFKTTYTYNANSAVGTKIFYTNGSPSGTSVDNITLDGNQRIVRVDTGPTSNNTYSYTYSYTYDSLGNVASTAQFGPGVSYLWTDTYDSNKGPFADAKTILTSAAYKKNSLVKEVSTLNNTTSTYNFAYVYNSDGYPVSNLQTITGNHLPYPPVTTLYTYITK